MGGGFKKGGWNPQKQGEQGAGHGGKREGAGGPISVENSKKEKVGLDGLEDEEFRAHKAKIRQKSRANQKKAPPPKRKKEERVREQAVKRDVRLADRIERKAEEEDETEEEEENTAGEEFAGEKPQEPIEGEGDPTKDGEDEVFTICFHSAYSKAK